MLGEFLGIFFVCYLYSMVLLLPLYIYYFAVSPRRSSHASLHRMHKWVLAITICAPILFAIAMFPPGSAGNPGESLQSRETLVVGTSVTHQNAVPGEGADQQVGYLHTVRDYHQIIWGVSYYLVDIIAGLSLIGVVVLLCRAAIQRLYTSYLQRSNPERRFSSGCHVFVSDRIAQPFSSGLITRKVFLPESLEPADAQIVLSHEINHFRKRHHHWSLLETVVSHLFWFNPISHLLHRKGVALRELECDMETIRTVDKYAYSRTLLKTAQCMVPSVRPGLLVQRWIRKGTLKGRLESILNRGENRKRWPILVGFFLVLTLSAIVFVPVGLLGGGKLEEDLMERVRTEYGAIMKNREGVTIDEVPDHLIKILIFNEDAGFYNHEGVSVRAILRAAVNNLSGGPLQGASTITQQLSKVFYVKDQERTLGRKLQMIKAARVLEEHFSKEQILEMYLNSVYFGKGAYGVESASETFFDHPASELTIAESAMLVQSLSRPADYNCRNDPDRALQRTNQLLRRMVDENEADETEIKRSITQIEERLLAARI